MNWKEYKKQLLKNKDFKKEYEKLEPEYQVARAVVAARLRRGLTQSEVAERVKTRQSVISRLENANTIPTLSFLQRLASALRTEITVTVRPF